MPPFGGGGGGVAFQRRTAVYALIHTVGAADTLHGKGAGGGRVEDREFLSREPAW